MGMSRIKMLTLIDLVRKRVEDNFDEADHKAYCTVLDCFIDSFLTQAETTPPDYRPMMPRARLTNIIEQINKMRSKHKAGVDPQQVINLALRKAEEKRIRRGEVCLKNAAQKDHLDLMEYLLVFTSLIRHSFTYSDQDSSAVVFKSKVNIKNLSDSLQIVTMEHQHKDLSDLYFSVIEFLRSQHNVDTLNLAKLLPQGL